jgi:general secretion pathway protein M
MTPPFAEAWRARTAREKVLIAGLGVILALWAGIAGLWQPLQAHRAAVLDDIARYTRTATVLTTAAASGIALPAPASDAPLPAVITDTATAYQLTIRRLQPTADAAEIVLDDAPFEAVLIWLEALERDQGLRIRALTLTRRPEPGIVGATLTVGR